MGRIITLHPNIRQRQPLENLARAKIVETDRLEGAKPIAIVNMYLQGIRESGGLIDGRYKVLKVIQDAEDPRQKIGSARLYHPEDISIRLGDERPDGYSQIISVGRSPERDLRPVTTIGDKRVRDPAVSKCHCAISYDPYTHHIQISDIGNEQGSYTHGTYVNGSQVRTTEPWEAGDWAEMGQFVSRESTKRMTILDYSITSYGSEKGVNRARFAAKSIEAPGGLHFLVVAGIL